MPPHKMESSVAKEVAEKLGEGRMSVLEKAAYLEKYSHKFFFNEDFVSIPTYETILKTLDLHDKKIVNVGAGFSLRAEADHFTTALQNVAENITLFPVDYNHARTTSWLLLDSQNEDKEVNDTIHLEPVTADATKLPFEDSSMHGYASVNLVNEPRLEEYNHIFVEKLLQEAFRILKDGGFILLSSFGYNRYLEQDGTERFNDSMDREDIITSTELQELLVRVGFKNIQSLPIDGNAVEQKIKDLKKQEEEIGAEVSIEEACAYLAFK